MQCLRRVIDTQTLHEERETVRRIVTELDLELLDCAAALLHIHKMDGGEPAFFEKKTLDASAPNPVIAAEIPKMVRYRLAIGHKHGVSKEMIKDVLVDESGVERKMIRFVDLRNEFTIVELPEGMPEDIFQHLKTIEIKRQKLDIKKLSANSNKRRANSRRRKKQRTSRLESKESEGLNCKEMA